MPKYMEPHYIPTPEEQQRAMAEIQKGWSDHERQKRMVQGSVPVSLEPIKILDPHPHAKGRGRAI